MFNQSDNSLGSVDTPKYAADARKIKAMKIWDSFYINKKYYNNL